LVPPFKASVPAGRGLVEPDADRDGMSNNAQAADAAVRAAISAIAD
jgi:hypothetical protein